jgi:elongator complex protein 3
MLKSGEIEDRDQLQKVKVRLSKEYGLGAVPPNSEILADVREEDRKALRPFLMKKPMRTLSGVAVVAVMTSPYPCPHGKCSYCPGGVENGSPQSYTGKEPAARRAERNEFDPFRQVSDRISQLSSIGHMTDKIDLIIMGGTFTSRDPGYKEWFVRRCFDAMNGVDSPDLESAQNLNETSAHRCVGLTVETRPDVFGTDQIDEAMALGTTRVELGVQILDDAVLEGVGRGHRVAAVNEATKACKDRGLKVCYHLMPGLPGSSPEKDMECFLRVFSDPDFRPDMLKFYPTLVISGTSLYGMWERGEYLPYDLETAVSLLADMKSAVPEYVRIQRIQRDIPVPQISAGITRSNIRELVKTRLQETGRECRCIRCREVGHADVRPDAESTEFGVMEYEASGGTERFISLECGDSVIGYVRLRTDGTGTATVRELKVFGMMAAIGSQGEDWQHRGFGRALMERAEGVATESGATRIRVTSGVGVRGYYRSLGYSLRAPYMVKELSR